MRQINSVLSLTVLLVFSSLTPVGAVPVREMFFEVQSENPIAGFNNPGTISYAGGKTPLVGRDIAINNVTHTIAFTQPGDFRCATCKLDFVTGPFTGTIPSVEPGVVPSGYTFGGGGSLQITGGAHFAGLSIPAGSLLLEGRLSHAEMEYDFGLRHELTRLTFESVTLNPSLASHFGLPTSNTAHGLIATTENGDGPNPFVLSTFTHFSEDASHIRVFESQTVPLPDTLWLFVVGMGLLVLWWERRRSLNLSRLFQREF
jgi:hypothetical protein